MKISGYFIALFLLAVSAFRASGDEGGYPFLWGGFSTSLDGRSPAQTHNAARAARDLEGTVIPPGGVFSFNGRVGGRDREKGYREAPIIGDSGYLQDITGGGVCQLATTIYNAALYAGLEIVERHPHSRAVLYVPPGRDATIATWRKDLKLRNPHGVPLVLKIAMKDRRMTASFWAKEKKPFQVEIQTDSVPLEPTTVMGGPGRDGFREQPGGKGFKVTTKRTFRKDGRVREQILNVDLYPPPSRILKGGGS